MLQVHQFPCLMDNYGYLIHEPEGNKTAAIDTPDPDKIMAALAHKGWTLDYIFNTHHHFDHAGGNLELKEKTGCQIIGPKGEADKIPALDKAVGEKDRVALGAEEAVIFDVPGHTLGHIVYYFASSQMAFVGDTLFALGCGRLFEGTPIQMWDSLQKLMALPDATTIYCAHEYTQANAKFALTMEPKNQALRERSVAIDEARKQNQPTVPTTIALEKATNPFLRPMSAELQQTLNMVGAKEVDIFAETRARKDNS